MISLKLAMLIPEIILSLYLLYLLALAALFLGFLGMLVQLKSKNQINGLIFSLVLTVHLLINDTLTWLKSSTPASHIERVANFFFYNILDKDSMSQTYKFLLLLTIFFFFSIFSNFSNKLVSGNLTIFLFSAVGFMLICSSSSILTTYLVIELSSLALYTLTALKKVSNYSVRCSLKYFLIGSFASAIYLFGKLDYV